MKPLLFLVACLCGPTAFAGPTAPHVARAAADLDAFPQDFRAAMALGAVSVAQQDWSNAERGYRTAYDLSDGNLDAGVGLVTALVAQQRHKHAAQIADGLVMDYPDEPKAWLAKGWAWRFRDLPGRVGVEVATAAYRKAASLDPAGADAWCGLGWMRASRGDGAGAQEAFKNARQREAAPGCGVYGAKATAPQWSGHASVFAVASSYAGHHSYKAGGGVGVQVGAALGDNAWLDVTARGMAVLGKDESVFPGAPAGLGGQREVWARAGGQVGRFGGTAVLGTSGQGTGRATTVGGLAWFTLGPSVRLEGARTTFEDGSHTQLGAAFIVPVTRRVTVSSGWRWTQLDRSTIRVGDHSLWASVDAQLGDSSLSVGARSGHEHRPVRLLQAAAWNIDARLGPSLFGDVSVPIRKSLSLQVGAELATFDYPDGPVVGPFLPPEPSTTGGQVLSGNVGLTWSFGAARQEK